MRLREVSWTDLEKRKRSRVKPGGAGAISMRFRVLAGSEHSVSFCPPVSTRRTVSSGAVPTRYSGYLGVRPVTTISHSGSSKLSQRKPVTAPVRRRAPSDEARFVNPLTRANRVLSACRRFANR